MEIFTNLLFSRDILLVSSITQFSYKSKKNDLFESKKETETFLFL